MHPRRLVALLALAALGSSRPSLAADAPQAWAIVAGVKVQDGRPGDPALFAGSDRDPRAFRRLLIEKAGWDASHILALEDSAPEAHGAPLAQTASIKATRANLDWACRDWLRARLHPGDFVVIYYAGRAFPGRDADSGRILAVSTDRQGDSGWALDSALDAVASSGENPTLVVLDVPHPEAFAGPGNAALPPRLAISDRMLATLTRWPGVSAWMSGRPAGPTGKNPFHDALARGLGTASAPKNGLACLDALNGDRGLNASRFSVSGGLGPIWTLWPKSLRDVGTPPEILLQSGHSDRVANVVFTPDGATMVSSGMDSTIRVWRVADRALLRTLSGPTMGVSALAISPDGSILASGDGAGRVVAWPMDTFVPIVFTGKRPHSRGISRVEFLPGGSGFAALDLSGGLVLWTIEKDAIRPRRLADGIGAVAVGLDGIAASGLVVGQGTTIRRFRADGTALEPIAGPKGVVRESGLAVLSREGEPHRLVAGDRSGRMMAWSLPSGELLREWSFPGPIEAVAITDSGPVAAVGKGAIACRFGDATTKPLPLRDRASGLVVAPDGHHLAALSGPGEITLWDLDTPEGSRAVPLEKPAKGPRSLSVAFAPHGGLIASADQDGGIRGWSSADGSSRFAIAPHRGRIDALAVSADGRYLVPIDHDRIASVWDLRDGRGMSRIEGAWTSAAFLPGGSTLAMTRLGGDVVLVDRASGSRRPERFDPPGSPWGFAGVAVSPDGKTIAAGSPDGPLVCAWPATGGARRGRSGGIRRRSRSWGSRPTRDGS